MKTSPGLIVKRLSQLSGEELRSLAQYWELATQYPTTFASEEEMRFPLASALHYLRCVTGEITYFDQNTDSRGILHAGETLCIERKDQKNYLDFRAQAGAEGARAVWAAYKF